MKPFLSAKTNLLIDPVSASGLSSPCDEQVWYIIGHSIVVICLFLSLLSLVSFSSFLTLHCSLFTCMFLWWMMAAFPLIVWFTRLGSYIVNFLFMNWHCILTPLLTIASAQWYNAPWCTICFNRLWLHFLRLHLSGKGRNKSCQCRGDGCRDEGLLLAAWWRYSSVSHMPFTSRSSCPVYTSRA